ncbi:efflux RND transporter periplasmic adaptor subunit [Consotaella aegiceratis]|uniref:efflux RND transporter periplasmic adaptor subunit n=1 Tax=Consotaella aegiceratis TaxID=3097961 RepID=UPI002F3FC67E
MFPKFLLAAISASLFALALGCLPAISQTQQTPTVTVMTAKPADFTQTTRLPGRIKASTIAEVRPQVSGIIKERLFEEGARVTEDEPLYKIDDQTYQAALAAVEASVTQAQANFDLAVIDAERAQKLFSSNTGSAAARDTANAQRDAASAALQTAQAQLTSAKIDLDRTTIRAPVAGVIGLSQTTTGALVAAQQTTTLATIRTLDPVYVDVTLSATDLLNWGVPFEGGELAKASDVSLILPTGQTYGEKGELSGAEPQVEPTTGMVTLRISFPNPDYRLLPGLYVEAEFALNTVENAILVPQSAVTRDPQGGAHAWVVEDGKVAVRDLTILAASDNNWVVTSGLNEGDQVVTSGFQKAGPGAPVQIVEDEWSAEADTGDSAATAALESRED